MRIALLALIWGLMLGTGLLGLRALSASRRRRILDRLDPPPPSSSPAVPTPVEETVRELCPGADPTAIWSWIRPVGVLVVLVAALQAPFPMLPAALLALTGAALVRRWRGADPSSRGIADDAELLASALRAGAAPRTAVAALVDGGDPRWAGVVAALEAGLPLRTAVDAWAGDHEDPGALLLADAWAVAGSTGASAAAALTRVGATLRERATLEREITALTAQALLSARVLTIVPVGFAVLVAAVDHRVADFLLTSRAGHVCVLTGVLLDRLGARWMRHLVEAAR